MTALALGIWFMFIGSIAAVEIERSEQREAERLAARKQIVINMPAPGQP